MSGSKLHPAEALVQQLFAKRCHLELRPIPTSNVPTPDFEVFHDGKRVAVLEVKAMTNTTVEIDISDAEHAARIETEFGLGASDDKGANRVATKLRSAVAQLAGTDAGKVVVFVNEELVLDRDDLREVLQGFLRFGGEKITSLSPAVTQRLAEDRMKADLYIWIEVRGAEAPDVTMWSLTDLGMKLRRDVFGATVTHG